MKMAANKLSAPAHEGFCCCLPLRNDGKVLVGRLNYSNSSAFVFGFQLAVSRQARAMEARGSPAEATTADMQIAAPACATYTYVPSREFESLLIIIIIPKH